MRIGRFEIEQLSEGFFETSSDGFLSKIAPARLEELKKEPAGPQRSDVVGIDPLLVRDGETTILLDAGLGWGLDHGSSYEGTSNAVTNLEIFGFSPESIDFVVLSHLHYDHVAGSTHLGPDLRTTLTFPNAVWLVQKREWEHALREQSRTDSTGSEYRMDELYRLAADRRIHFIENDSYTLLPGIRLLLTGGHTPGHQIVHIGDEGKSAWYPGDLIPTEHHLNRYVVKEADFDPVRARKVKTLLLRDALQSNAYLFFYHSLFRKNGQILRDRDRNYVLVES